MLYFIKSLNYLKVGYSQDIDTLKSRIHHYLTHNPNFTLLSFTEYGSLEDEIDIHWKMKKFLHYSEWFKDDIEVYNIWESFVKKRNLIPKNCYLEFPKDLEIFNKIKYRSLLDSTPLKFPKLNEEIYTELNEINLLKYFGRKLKSFSQEDFSRACSFASKELGIKVTKSILKKFGYDIAGNTGIICVYKLKNVFFD